MIVAAGCWLPLFLHLASQLVVVLVVVVLKFRRDRFVLFCFVAIQWVGCTVLVVLRWNRERLRYSTHTHIYIYIQLSQKIRD